MRSNWPKLASMAQNTLQFSWFQYCEFIALKDQFFQNLFFNTMHSLLSKINPFKIYF